MPRQPWLLSTCSTAIQTSERIHWLHAEFDHASLCAIHSLVAPVAVAVDRVAVVGSVFHPAAAAAGLPFLLPFQ